MESKNEHWAYEDLLDLPHHTSPTRPRMSRIDRAAQFGAFMALMMAVSHRLYASHPEWSQEAFPIVRALSGLGRKGFLLSAALVYLSVFTSLTAVMYALRCAAQEQTDSPLLRLGLLFGLPLAVSVVGFAGIVDRFYAPAGLLCLLAVFLPLWQQSRA